MRESDAPATAREATAECLFDPPDCLEGAYAQTVRREGTRIARHGADRRTHFMLFEVVIDCLGATDPRSIVVDEDDAAPRKQRIERPVRDTMRGEAQGTCRSTQMVHVTALRDGHRDGGSTHRNAS